VGGAISLTGQYAAPAGRQVNSIRPWVDDVNARGGLLGHRIALRLLDDKSDIQTSIKLYEKLITEDKVDVLLAPYSSGITEAVANVTERYKMPIVAYGASASPIWEKGRRYIFNIVAVAETFQKGAVHLAKQLGATAEYVLGFSLWEPLPGVLGYPGMKEYIERYEKRYGEKPNYHAGGAYGALQVTEAALKHVGSFDSEKLRDALATIEVQTVFGRYKVDAKGMNSHEGLTFQILRGQRRVVWPEKWAETKAELPIPEWS